MEGIWTHRKYLGILLNRDGHVESQARSLLIMKEALLLPKHMLNRLLLRKKITQKKMVMVAWEHPLGDMNKHKKDI